MILSFKMKGDVISDHILMLGFQKILFTQSVLGLLGLLGGRPRVQNKSWILVDQVDHERKLFIGLKRGQEEFMGTSGS